MQASGDMTGEMPTKPQGSSREKQCNCEAAKVEELYKAFYGQYEDHIGGNKNIGQRGKLPKLIGPKLWVPPWLDFTKSAPRVPESAVPETRQFDENEEETNNLQLEGSRMASRSTHAALIDVLEEIENTPSENPKSVKPTDVEEDVLSLSDVQFDEIEEPKLIQPKKRESIRIKDIQSSNLFTPSVVLFKLESRMKIEITPSFISLISFIEVAVKAVRLKIMRYKHRSKLAALGFSGSKKRIFAGVNDIFVSVLTGSGCCYQIYCRGEEDVRLVPAERQGPYIVCLTGLSGSIENLECCLEMGSIFSIYKKDPKLTTFSPRTANMSYKYLVSSGYALYSTSTNLVMSVGRKLLSFVLDPVLQEFILNDDNIKIPEKGTQISVDEGHSGIWEPQILEYMKRKKDPKQGRPLKARYVGCLVADFHRTLYLGGIYLYPANRKYPQGKTTLLCECVPLSHIIHLAGGTASTGKTDVLKMDADQLGQYIPFFIGSQNEVQELLLITSSPTRG